MRLVIISGLSGSGKSVALNVLEDAGFYCIDNIPVGLLQSFVEEIMPRSDQAYDNVGVGLDARNVPDIKRLPEVIERLREAGAACEVIFLQADDDILLSRFNNRYGGPDRGHQRYQCLRPEGAHQRPNQDSQTG